MVTAGFDDPAFFGDRWASAYENLTGQPDPGMAVEGVPRRAR